MQLNLAKELAAMEQMTVGQLHDRYVEVFGDPRSLGSGEPRQGTTRTIRSHWASERQIHGHGLGHVGGRATGWDWVAFGYVTTASRCDVGQRGALGASTTRAARWLVGRSWMPPVPRRDWRWGRAPT